MPWNALITATLVLAAIPLGMLAWNLTLYRPAPRQRKPAENAGAKRGVSVLIPARDEEDAIEDAVRSVLAAADGSHGRGHGDVDLEVIVLDDQSTDRTAAIVKGLARDDGRVRLAASKPLPDGWVGKQYACAQLAELASHETLCWIDADVRLEPGSLRPMADRLWAGDASLLSGVPRQETGTLAERLIVHLIPLVLLGYLPIARMRKSLSPGFGAGCGQLFLARTSDYRKCGGHGAAGVRGSMHDGVTLPRAFRSAGLMTDLFDATDAARCRMYRGLRACWFGFAKNATEGMATPVGVVVWTVLLLGGHVLPSVWMALWLAGFGPVQGSATAVTWAFALAGMTSVAVATRFRQGWEAAVFRPWGVLLLLGIQYFALARKLAGYKPSWRGREVAAG